MEDLITLAIETSCDETAVAIVKNGRYVLSNIIDTQIPIHTKYGGVVPEIASRNHIQNINYVCEKALADANLTFDDIDFISVANRPGLVGSLLVGVSFAKALSFALSKPLVGVHHKLYTTFGLRASVSMPCSFRRTFTYSQGGRLY